MTTIEGQLAVLGGAATRPQGDTEVSFLWLPGLLSCMKLFWSADQ
jgi:hypothetical protein